MIAAIRQGLVGFGHFWWDFLIGDTPELALATGVIVAVNVTFLPGVTGSGVGAEALRTKSNVPILATKASAVPFNVPWKGVDGASGKVAELL